MAELAHQHPIGSLKAKADVWDHVGVLRRGWRLIAVCIVLSMTCMVIYLLLVERVYQATARLVVVQQVGRPVNLANNDPTRAVEGMDDYIPTHALLLSSPMVLQRAIDAVGLDNLPTLVTGSEKQGLRPVDVAALNLRVTRPDRLAKVLKMDYWASSREEAVRMLQAVTESYRSSIEDTYEKKSNETIALIAKARDVLSKELEEREAQYLQYRRDAPYSIGDESGRTITAQRLERSAQSLKQFEETARRLKFQHDIGDRLAKEGAEMWAVAHAINQIGGDSTSLNAAFNAGLSPGGASDYVRQLNSEQQQLAERFGADNAKVQTIRNQIARIQERARDSRGRMGQTEVRDLMASIKQSLEAVDSMREDAARQYADEQAGAKKMEIEMLTGSNLRAQLERHRLLFNTVLDQLKQAESVGELTSITSQVIEPPYALRKPTSPKVLSMLVASMVLGTVAGVGSVSVADRMDQRIRSIKALRMIITYPVLTLIGRVRGDEMGEGKELGLISEDRPRSLPAEGYRSLRTNLDFLRRSRQIQVILVTSPHSGDGKSITASNLAITLAQAGRKVLLVDGDLRKSSQSKIHASPNVLGVSDILASGVDYREALRATAIANLDLITAGTEVPNSADLLTSPRLAAFVESLRPDYDLIVVDSPPVLTVTDPAILSTVADGVILVVRASKLRHQDAELVMEWAQSLTTSVLGMVVNATTQEETGYSYGYGHTNGSLLGGFKTSASHGGRAFRNPSGPLTHDYRHGAGADDGPAPSNS